MSRRNQYIEHIADITAMINNIVVWKIFSVGEIPD